MVDTTALSPDTPQNRIVSVDVLRGLTMWMMVFVNDLAGVRSAPAWMKHVSASTDGMTFVDLVFPAFLFVMGMSIPLALGKRLFSPAKRIRAWFHVTVRTLSLLVIGVLMVNSPGREAMGWPSGLWKLLVFACFFLGWHSIPAATPGRVYLSRILRACGFLGLAILAAMFRNSDGGWLAIQWWGILGIIGWAYLIATVVFALTGGRHTPLVGSFAILLLVYVAMRERLFMLPFVNGGTIGAHPAIAVAGVIAGTLLTSGKRSSPAVIRWALVYTAFLAAAAWLVRPWYGISKIYATPSWCLWASAIFCFAWIAIYYAVDVRGMRFGTRFFGAVGKNALFAYLLSSIFYYVFSVAHIDYWALAKPGFAAGLARAVLYATAISGISAWAGSAKIRLKL